MTDPQPRPQLTRSRRVIGVVGEVLITLGVVVLLFVVWQLWWTDVLAGRAQAEARGDLQREWTIGSADQQLPPGVAPAYGKAFGLMYVPGLRDRAWGVPIIEGTEHDLLSDGVDRDRARRRFLPTDDAQGAGKCEHSEEKLRLHIATSNTRC